MALLRSLVAIILTNCNPPVYMNDSCVSKIIIKTAYYEDPLIRYTHVGLIGVA